MRYYKAIKEHKGDNHAVYQYLCHQEFPTLVFGSLLI